MGSRRKARECALQLLYQKEMTQQPNDFILREYWLLEKTTDDTREFASDLFMGVLTKAKELDAVIEECTLNWDIERIALIDRNILRIALYEIMFLENIPVAVSINEAIDIAKMYSTIESGKFVNGILDKAKKRAKSNDKDQE